jgi:ankyrin repeat protein
MIRDLEGDIPQRQDTGSGRGGYIKTKILPVSNKRKNRKIMEIGLQFLEAAKDGDAPELEQLLEEQAPVNFIDPVDHATALHYIAAYAARPALRVVLSSGKCDHLIRDAEGRLPSEIAREYGHDRAMARLLLIKEVRQARAQGLDPRHLYKVSARQPAP